MSENDTIEEGWVSLKLAHPLSKDDATRVQAKVKRDYFTNQHIIVTRDWGMALIDAGRVQVDPVDRVAVRKALGLNHRDQPLTAEERAELNGDGEAAAAVPAPVEGQQSAADAPEGEKAASKPRRVASHN